MAKFFLILTILLSIAAAILGFQTKSKLGGISTTIAKANADATDAKSKLQKAKDDLKTAQAEATTANDKANTAVAESSKAKMEAEKAVADLTDAKSQLETTKKALDDANAKIAQQPTPPTTPPADPQMEQKLKDAQAQAQEFKQLADTLQAKLKDDDSKIESLNKQVAGQKVLAMRPGLEGQVMAVNQGWNFVVISIGDRQGAVANNQLIIKRGDTMIGRVKITSVEPSTSIADIIPDSLAKGQRVMPGDRVIFPVQ